MPNRLGTLPVFRRGSGVYHQARIGGPLYLGQADVLTVAWEARLPKEGQIVWSPLLDSHVVYLPRNTSDELPWVKLDITPGSLIPRRVTTAGDDWEEV